MERLRDSTYSLNIPIDRRNLILGIAASILSGCGGGGGDSSAPPGAPTSDPSPATAPAPSPTTSLPDGAVPVSKFYRAELGPNWGPAVQAAVDYAAVNGKSAVVNDRGAISIEMWCPLRTSGFGEDALDGYPLVIRAPVDIDFRGASIALKGPSGSADKAIGQAINNGSNYPWLGGWLRLRGGSGFGRFSLSNVVVDGGFSGEVNTNTASNISDKGFLCITQPVAEINMTNVELRNFAGEIMFDNASAYHYSENCHFHGSPQCAWNPCGLGTVKAVNLEAGRAYQAGEVIGGGGHSYQGGRFYDAQTAGCTILGGPTPSWDSLPYWFAHCEAGTAPPYVNFNGTTFERCALRLGSWMRGSLKAVDAPVWFSDMVGHLQDIELQIDSWTDQASGVEAVGLWGPADLSTQVPNTPEGTYYVPPSNINLTINCARTDAAVAATYTQPAAVRLFGGLLDKNSVKCIVAGQARTMWEIFGSPSPVTVPQIINNGFTALVQ